MTQFFNRREDVVTEAIDGLVAAAGGRLARLDGYPHIRVVVRNDQDRGKVAVVSGGGAGHEPSHAGFVGRGMLTAAVCGDVFASPSVDAVLAGILAVTGPAGCLLIVKNYTGDRLNFGLAAERARALGLAVRIVIVADDIALPDLPQPRGVAGTLLVHKIAGAVAEAGGDLDAVAAAAERVSAGVRSIGMSLDTCTVPGAGREDRIPGGRAELGLGIHGEAGVEQVDFHDARGAMRMVAEKLSPVMAPGRKHVVLLNNLGGATVLEMAVLAHELARSGIADRIGHLIGPAALMTALDMRGFSVSVFAADGDELAALAAPVAPAAWPGLHPLVPVAVRGMPEGLEPVRPRPSSDPVARGIVTACCESLVAAEAELNALDARAGDGDTGTTLARAARVLLAGRDALPLADTPALLRAIGIEIGRSMGGSSGVLLAIFFAAAGDAASSGKSLPAALHAGLVRMQEIGGARPGDRTMIDALAPALAALAGGGLEAAAAAAREGAEATARMTRARAGRSAYLGADQLAGAPDPGAWGVKLVLEALARAH